MQAEKYLLVASVKIVWTIQLQQAQQSVINVSALPSAGRWKYTGRKIW